MNTHVQTELSRRLLVLLVLLMLQVVAHVLAATTLRRVPASSRSRSRSRSPGPGPGSGGGVHDGGPGGVVA